MYRSKAAASAFVLWAIVALGGCVVVPAGGYYGGYYPYGYAPYGARYVTPDGYTVAYNYGPGVYTVVGVPGLYWWGGNYYRWHGGHWQWSRHHSGPWGYRSANRVPFVAHRGWHGGTWHGHRGH
jgi:hypothetical protein